MLGGGAELGAAGTKELGLCLELSMNLEADDGFIVMSSHGGIKDYSIPLDKEVHEPAENQGSDDHDRKERNPIANPGFFFGPPDKRQNGRHKSRVDDHGQEQASKHYFFFPAAIS